MVYFSSCFNNTDNKLLVVQYYMLLVVSGFQEMNSVHISYLSFVAGLFLYVAWRLRGDSSLFYFYNFWLILFCGLYS